MPDTTKQEAPVEETSTGQVEVTVEYEGHTFTTYAKSKKEGERIIKAHIAMHSTDPQPAE